MENRITIKDIADKAGVSRGTVDRVLHNRGKVSAKVKEKVLAVLAELGYERNLIASTLAYNRTLTIATLVPDPSIDPYWEQPQQGIEAASNSVKYYGVSIEPYFFNLFDPASFQKKSEEVLNAKPDAILLAPVFQREAESFLKSCKKENIPTLMINTNIESSAPLCYIGQDSYHSGVLAGRLLNFGLPKSSTAMILHLGPMYSNAKHIIDKEKGFRDYFSKIEDKNIRVINEVFEEFDNSKKLGSFFDKQLKKHGSIFGVFITNSRAYKLVNALKPEIAEKIKIVGFDLIKPNIDFLYEGKIDFLINQNSIEQGYLGVLSIVNHLILQKHIDRIQHLPLDIVVIENIQYYLKKPKEFQIFV